MSWWKTLAQIGLVGAAPFTGGASLAAMPLVNAIGSGASAAADSMAKNRGTELSAGLDANKQFEDELLKREAFNQQSQNNNLRQSVFSSLLAGYQPPARPAGITSAFASPGQPGQDALNFTAKDALAKLQGGPALSLPTNTDMADPRAMAAQLSKSSAWEKLLGILGAGASAYGATAGKGGGSNPMPGVGTYSKGPF